MDVILDKALMVYDRLHNPLAEIDDYQDDLVYGWTLDDIDTLTVSLPLSSQKCTPANVQLGNHIELIAPSGLVVWGGVITGHSFEDTVLKLNCCDYSVLLKYRRLRAKVYGEMEYGALMQQLIEDTQAGRPDYPIGLTGYNVAAGAVQTQREVDNTDMLWAKIKDIGDDANYDYGVTSDRVFNFWLRRGADKPQYVLQWGGVGGNIITKPTLAHDIMSLANSIYAQTDGDAPLTSNAEDTASVQTYGLYEGAYSPNGGITVQSTLDTQVAGELQRDSVPADNLTLTVRDSQQCPFDKIEVGDRITVHLIPYFDYTASVRILAMAHAEKTNTRELTVGSIVFKPQPPAKRLYKG